MVQLQINRMNNPYFYSQMRYAYADKIEKLPILKEEIFSVKSRIKGSYLYTKDCLMNLFVSGKMDKKTFLRRMGEIGKQYTKLLQKNGINI